jgi:hypothetical protein
VFASVGRHVFVLVEQGLCEGEWARFNAASQGFKEFTSSFRKQNFGEVFGGLGILGGRRSHTVAALLIW